MLFMTRRLPLKIYLVGFPALNRQQMLSRMGVHSTARSAVCQCPVTPVLVHVRVQCSTHLIAESSPMVAVEHPDYTNNSQLSPAAFATAQSTRLAGCGKTTLRLGMLSSVRDLCD